MPYPASSQEGNRIRIPMRSGEISALPASGGTNVRIYACMGPLVILLRDTLPLFLAFLMEVSSPSGLIGNIISICKLRRAIGISLEKTRGLFGRHMEDTGQMIYGWKRQ